ncbi:MULTISPECIES: aldo/keto reductase family oxidoreductase [Bacillales]|uniref:aldo/keto reductase n=1 Tax=Bacillales TaxID=1385 RepID=UPI0006A7674E|nr:MULTISPECIES: aldo/keto reductase [Bacillales]OBZ17753.1 oxidoreductase [Bacillus sp. FJAT-26390]
MERLVLTDEVQFSRMIHGHWRLAEWNLGPSKLMELMQFCMEEQGITTFDHADIYGDYTCEALFGQALALQPSLRSNMQIVTKCGIKLISGNRSNHAIKHYDTRKSHIISSVERSLMNIKTDYIDLLLIHRPNPLMDPAEVAEAFVQLKETGKVRAFGVSNFLPAQFQNLSSYLPFPLVTNQLEISVSHVNAFSDGSLDLCQEKRIAPMAWSPLAGGQLFQATHEKALKLKKRLQVLAEETNAESIDQVMYAWLLHHPSRIMPIIGSGNRERIAAGAAALRIKLSDQQWFDIWQSSNGKEVD